MTYNHAYTCALVYELPGDISSWALGSIRHKIVTYFRGLLPWNVSEMYLFIYCHLYSAFPIVQCSNMLQKFIRWREKGHTGPSSVREIDVHTVYNQWATAPSRNLNYPKLKSITHLCTFRYIGVYEALQLILIIVVSDQWYQVLIPYSCRLAPCVHLHALGWLSQYTW